MISTLFTKDHEWIKFDGENTIVGITHYAQDQLGNVVFVELPEINKSFNQGDEASVVESVKAASEIYAPISGLVIEVNENLIEQAGLINSDPESLGWLWKMTPSNKDELGLLMNQGDYLKYVEDLS